VVYRFGHCLPHSTMSQVKLFLGLKKCQLSSLVEMGRTHDAIESLVRDFAADAWPVTHKMFQDSAAMWTYHQGNTFVSVLRSTAFNFSSASFPSVKILPTSATSIPMTAQRLCCSSQDTPHGKMISSSVFMAS
jgi:hypothetical protein